MCAFVCINTIYMYMYNIYAIHHAGVPSPSKGVSRALRPARSRSAHARAFALLLTCLFATQK